jgi:16S rRNA (adenine1518-N6/adenine1519-N6)-dimethyltransferase
MQEAADFSPRVYSALQATRLNIHHVFRRDAPGISAGAGMENEKISVHTESDIVRILRDAGIRPSKRRGQNFLIDHNVLEVITQTCELQSGDTILEVGTGTGLLTEHLARKAGRVVTVEIDKRLCALAREYLSGYSNVIVIEGDILRKGKMNPEVLSALKEEGERKIKVCGNLPYSIATPFLLSLLGQISFSLGVFVVQDEVARRITAKPKSREYGAMSVIMGEYFSVSLARKIHPNCFYPVPRVYSRMMVVRPGTSAADTERFSQFVHTLFSQKRKNLSNFLRRLFPEESSEQRTQRLISLGIMPTSRAEELSHQQILSLYRALSKQNY